jgi:uncharacterized integral membrane protein
MENQKKTNTFLWIVYGIITIFLVVFVLQNKAPIDINLLGLKLTGRAFVVFPVLLGIGFFSGWLFEYIRQSRKARKEEKRFDRRVRYSEE